MHKRRFSCANEYITEICGIWGDRPFIKDTKNTDQVETYRDFYNAVLAVAGLMIRHRICPGSRVVLELDNSIIALTYFFGALLSGVVPVVATSKNKVSELILFAGKCDAKAFFLTEKKAETVTGYSDLPVYSFKRPVDENVSLPDLKSGSGDTAYILFTTGSTGTPKIINVSHGNMLAEIVSMAEAYDFTPNDRHYCVLPLSHVSGLYRGILLPFHTGGVILLDEDFAVDTFWGWINSDKISFVQVVPTILRKLLQYPDYFELGHEKTLRCIGSASAPHPVDLIKSFEERFGVYVLQGYGLTEATCGITLNPLNRKERKLGSVGKPLSVNQVKVLSDDDEVLPPGQSGRIFVYGDNIASFDDNSRSFESEAPPPSDRALETGDIGYVDEDGFVWLQSRSSDLIKRGGYRMSTVEIEAAILEANPNAEVAVIGVPHPVLGQDVIAFVVKRETDCKARDIIRSIKSKIASYKIPSEIVFIESLPMIGVGKVDKKTLLQSFMKDTKNRD